MFESGITRDDRSRRLTRRLFVAGAVVGVAGVGLGIRNAPRPEESTVVHGNAGVVSIVEFTPDGKALGPRKVAKVVKSDGEWLRQLGRNSFDIARRADTEMPFSGVSWRQEQRGIYRCVGCETALFGSGDKFDSHTGWPSFSQPLARQNLVEAEDRSLGVQRTEIRCVRCEGHLGHLFHDGPAPTGLRYCMNSASMRFVAG